MHRSSSKEADGGEASTTAAASTSTEEPHQQAAADEATYLELMKKAIKQRQKAQKLALLLGPHVPPAPPRRMLL